MPTLDGDRCVMLRRAGGLVALTVGWLHIFHPDLGIWSLLLYLELGTVYDPRPPLFVISGVAVIIGTVLAYKGIARRAIYASGIVLMAAYLVGYGAWHTVLDHGAFWPHLGAHSHHDTPLLSTIIFHLANDPLALVSKAAEATLLLTLVVLLLFEDGG